MHLEGSIGPTTLLDIARRNGVELPTQDEAGLREWFAFRDFAHFIEVYTAITRCLRTVEDYEQIAYEFGAQMARQNIRYAEITFTPATDELRFGVPHDVYFSGLSRGRRRAEADFGIMMRWVFDMVHVTSDAQINRRAADFTLGVALEGKDEGVVALGLGGPEYEDTCKVMAPWFERARSAGLHSTPHAGETTDATSVWNAINLLGAERIGHGVQAIHDPTLVSYLAEQHIPLELCPTSNLRLGIFPTMQAHPLRAFHDAGVPFTVNSDDPSLFGTTLNDEVQLLTTQFGLDRGAIDEILLNGVHHSFLSEDQKKLLHAVFVNSLTMLWIGNDTGRG